MSTAPTHRSTSSPARNRPSQQSHHLTSTTTTSPRVNRSPAHSTTNIPGLLHIPQGTTKGASSSPSRRLGGGSEAEAVATADKGSSVPKANKPRNRSKPTQSNLSAQLDPNSGQTIKDDARNGQNSSRSVSTKPSTATPTKSKRRGTNRNKHQSSPTAAIQLDGDVTSSSETEPSSVPDSAALLALISGSATAGARAQSSNHPRHASDPLGQHSRRDISSGDEWDMPALAPVKAKENLSWQQELLAKGGQDSGRRSNNNDNSRRTGSGPPSRPTSARPGQNNGRQQSAKPRPVLQGSVSDSTGASLAAGASGLTWQQEMLQQLGGGPGGNTQSFGALEEHTTGTPDKRNRRNHQRDAETFGLGGLSVEDPFGPLTPSRQHNQARQAANHHASPRGQSSVQHAAVTPTKSAEPRYAGPTFHNSPAPSSLPMPSFMLRRQAAVGGQ